MMLSRVAARAVNGRASPAVSKSITATPQWTRSYSGISRFSDRRPNVSNRESGADVYQLPQDASILAHPANTTWNPTQGLALGRRAASSSSRKSRKVGKGASEKEDLSETQPEFETSANPDKSSLRQSSATGTASTSGTTGSEPARTPDVSPQQPEFESVASPQGGKDPNIETAATSADPTPQESQKPLPDLRHGIPSTFDQEYSDKSTSFKDEQAESPSLNLTEDPAAGGGKGRRGENDLPKEAYVSSIERRRNKVARYAYWAAAGVGLGSVIWFGRNWSSDEEAKANPDAPDGYDPVSMYNRIQARMSGMLGHWTEPVFPKLLPDLEPEMRQPYTLIVSLEDLLVHNSWTTRDGYKVAKRPGVDYFFLYLSQYYELCIFTSVAFMNADPILRKLDPYQVVMFPLFREATRYMKGTHVKDLSYLNRDLSKTIIIDTVPEHVQLQPENAIILPKWKGDAKDPHAKDLVALIPFLEYIATMGIGDVRRMIKSFEGTHIPTEFARREALAREEFNKRFASEKKKRGGVAGGLSSALGFKTGPSPMQIPGEQSFAEAYAAGKMPSDQARERGQLVYRMMEKELRETGPKMVAERERMEKEMMAESAKQMQGNLGGFFSGIIGSGEGGSSSSSSSSST